ncbi:uncharacterized protein IUM83_03754 [Phytophthora cinnamomi]|uniref:uncharacterized protein n=1 Tax=Phytophthora cinnamomi TaxID=4785 RepID=UPI00355A2B98|nr:hypothetical protein IUM83_03754 [Phytophthora cinnamomi]
MQRAVGSVKRFSSSPQQKPEAPGVWESYRGYSHRTWSRLGELKRYRDNGVFPPSNWMLQNWNLYLDLQLPSHTGIDAIEFLHGGPQQEGDVARDIEAMLSDQCYEKQFLPRLRGLAAGMGRVALVEFKITGAHLTKANCSNETPGTKKIKESLWTLAGKTMGLR